MEIYPDDPEAEPGGGAVIDPSGCYRYALWRKWATATPLPFVMLNPSTADASVDDLTIRRCCGFARSYGFGGVIVVNLYAYRATDPAALGSVADPVGPDNDEALAAALGFAGGSGVGAVAAWGKPSRLSKRMQDDVALRGAAVAEAARDMRTKLSSLAITADGHPRHPLYLPKHATLATWTAP